jgi:hypothetical protein
MKIVIRYFVPFCIAFLLSSCNSNVAYDVKKEVSGLTSEINTEILNEIRKSYPLPDPVTIRNAHNDDVNYTTTLTVEKVVEFYRQAYMQKGFAELEGSTVSSDSANLAFRDGSGGKTVHIMAENGNGETKVHLNKS